MYHFPNHAGEECRFLAPVDRPSVEACSSLALRAKARGESSKLSQGLVPIGIS